MTDRPIIFSAPMIRALLEGRKTQTRQLGWRGDYICPECNGQGLDAIHCPVCKGAGWAQKPSLWQKVKPGDRLWVRETWGIEPARSLSPSGGERLERFSEEVHYREHDKNLPGMRWRPSIHMPRWASRLTLCVTDVRRGRLQDITATDADAEGCYPVYENQGRGYAEMVESPRAKFRALWAQINGPDAWNQNPEVVALTFTVHTANIDQLGERAA